MPFAKLLIVTLPEEGHVLPTLSLSQRLRSLNIDVTFLSSTKFRSAVEGTGASFLPLLTEAGQPISSSGSKAWHDLRAERYGASTADVFFAALRRSTDLFNFQGLAIDFAIVRSGSNLSRHIPPLLKHVVLSSLLPDWLIPRHRIYELAPLLIQCPAFLEIKRYRVAHPLVLYGEGGLPPRRAGLPTQDHGSALNATKRVLVSFGSQVERYYHAPRILRALGETASANADLNVCVLLPPEGSTLLDSISFPGNVRVLYRANQQEELVQADLLITHGGLGSIKEALAANKPMVVIPHLYDQLRNATRIVRRKLGVALNPQTVDAMQLSNSISAILEGTFDRPVRRAQKLMWESEDSAQGAAFVANIIFGRPQSAA